MSIGAYNARTSKQFNRFIQRARRHFGGLEYFHVREVQARGVLHSHVLMRPARVERPFVLDMEAVREAAMDEGFGHEVMISFGHPNAAAYVAKYVSKGADERASLKWGETVGGRYRLWTASRGWGLSMGELRGGQRAKRAGLLIPLEGSYTIADQTVDAAVRMFETAGVELVSIGKADGW